MLIAGCDFEITYHFIVIRVSVRLGEYNTDTDVDCLENPTGKECADPAVDVPVDERIAHEEYDPQDLNQYNDIALLRLTRDVRFTGLIVFFILTYSNFFKLPYCRLHKTDLLANFFARVS